MMVLTFIWRSTRDLPFFFVVLEVYIMTIYTKAAIWKSTLYPREWTYFSMENLYKSIYISEARIFYLRKILEDITIFLGVCRRNASNNSQLILYIISFIYWKLHIKMISVCQELYYRQRLDNWLKTLNLSGILQCWMM